MIKCCLVIQVPGITKTNYSGGFSPMERVLKKAAGLISVCILFFVFVSVSAVNAEEKKEEIKAEQKDVPRIEFKERSHDFGKVVQDSKPKHIFTFKNTGTSKLVIEKVKAG